MIIAVCCACSVFAVRCKLFVAVRGCLLLVVRCMLVNVCCVLLRVPCCLLFAGGGCDWLFVSLLLVCCCVRRSFLVAGCSFCVVC